MAVKVAIVGATGYAGGELARLLLRHPEARLVAAVARGRQGEPLRDVQPHLHSAPPSLVVGADAGDAEVVFTALPAGEAAKLAPAWLAEGRRVIDIGSDFRLRDPKDYERWYSYTHPAPELLKEAVYGLTELTRSHLGAARGSRGGRHRRRCEVGRLRRGPQRRRCLPFRNDRRERAPVRRAEASPHARDRPGSAWHVGSRAAPHLHAASH